jgi:hypothetical protein
LNRNGSPLPKLARGRFGGRRLLAGCLASPAVLGLVASACSALATADDSPHGGALIRTVSYSTGSGAGKLKWLPYRPSPAKVTVDNQVVRAGGTALSSPDQSTAADSLTRLVPDAPARSSRPAPAPLWGGDPFKDPFNDARASVQADGTAEPPKEPTGSTLLPGPSGEPLNDRILQPYGHRVLSAVQ